MRMFVHGKAQTLLTMLFGFGFAAQLLRAQARDDRVVPLYLRRLVTLLVIGWLHVAAARVGRRDVGLRARRLLPARVPARLEHDARDRRARLRDRAEHHLRVSERAARGPRAAVRSAARVRTSTKFADTVHGGDRLAISKLNAVMGSLWTLGGDVLWYVPWLLGRFLLGYVVGAKRWFEGPRIAVFRKMLVVGVLVALPGLAIQILHIAEVLDPRKPGIAMKAVIAVVEELRLLGQVATYVAIVVMLMQRATWRTVLGILAPVGGCR